MTPFAVEKLTVYQKAAEFAECSCSILSDNLASLVLQYATVRSAD